MARYRVVQRAHGGYWVQEKVLFVWLPLYRFRTEERAIQWIQEELQGDQVIWTPEEE